MCDAHKKRIAVDIARAINQREEKRNHMKRRANLRIAMRREVPNPNLPVGVRIGTSSRSVISRFLGSDLL